MLFSIRWHRAIESLGIDVMCLFFDGSEQFLEVLMSLLRLMGAKYEVCRRFGFGTFLSMYGIEYAKLLQ